jgi:hypothetical protein
MASIIGTWTLTTDWGCSGSITGSFEMAFNADGTWSSSPFVHSGTWFQVEDVAVWTFDDVANLVYAGNLNGSWIEGAQGYTDDGFSGCFGGQVAGVPAAAEAAMAVEGAADPALGR